MMSDLEKQFCGILPWDHSREVNHIDLDMNFASALFNYEVAIIATCWRGQLPFLEAALKSYRLSGSYVIAAYDPPFCGWDSLTPLDWALPNPRMFLLAHSWVFKHITSDATKRNGWFWDIKYASGVLKMSSKFKYIFCANGDCIWEKPEGVPQIIDLLGDGDLMASSSCKTVTHTCSMILKRDAFEAIIDYMTDIMEFPVVGSHSPECMLRDAIKDLGLKEIIVPKQPLHPKEGYIDHYNVYREDCTWKEILGFRNLTAEQQAAALERFEPVEKNLCDWQTGNGMYLNNHEKATLYYYYKTGDRRWLYAFWDQGEDSWWDRIYRPIEHYADHPIYEEPQK